MLTTALYYNMTVRDYTKTLATTASEPSVSRESKYYLDNISKVTTIDGFLNNNRLFTYAMKAFGLGDMVYAKGMVRQILQQGTSDPRALANTLNDSRYKALAQTFDFANLGANATSTTTAGQNVVDKYVEMQLEDNVGKNSPGAEMALYLKRVAPTITSAYSILADKTLLQIVQTTFNLPSSMSALDIDVQAKMINSKMKISDLQDPTKLQTFTNRFIAMYDINNPNTGPSTPTNALLAQSSGLSSDLLMSLANLKIGGF
ncbi:DUF1217 domain-containing protein [Beijerinckia indica]|uniref:Flagellar basal-body rod protein FlgF n=1 Tax=Beijerinckia indica subsp. indica (strain ATCC 9039 / DSM 1715 / NCIMB 8712) TaxID=395963 RepID=B2IK03_BEII9|nr:DUF1217 domain-containing protein [Beijerinckia indica]ACB96378.1 protein of unknown function DUF1217 [Beijerinckia indica subsp. indica ATCC 9039]